MLTTLGQEFSLFMDVGFFAWAVGDVLLLFLSKLRCDVWGPTVVFLLFLGIFSMPRKMCDVGLIGPTDNTTCKWYSICNGCRLRPLRNNTVQLYCTDSATCRLPVIHALLDCDSVGVRTGVWYIHTHTAAANVSASLLSSGPPTTFLLKTGPFQSFVLFVVLCSELKLLRKK